MKLVFRGALFEIIQSAPCGQLGNSKAQKLKVVYPQNREEQNM